MSPEELLRVAAWLREQGVDVGDLSATQIAGGRSNLTYRLDDGGSAWVLRTPPRTGRTPSAHDVAREYRVTRALGPTDVPVAPAVGLCEDDDVLGAPFIVSGFVPGRAIQTAEQLETVPDVDAAVARVVEALAALHRVDHVAVGLEAFGRPDGYAARQLKRWSGQWEIVGTPEAAAAATALIERLTATLPDSGAVGIVHGDYRMDNTLMDFDGAPRVLAVVDWELSTIGDPVADVAMMCAYRNPALDRILGAPSAWTSPLLPDADKLASSYEAAGGAALAHWPFHLALAHFKIAVIAAGIAYRRRSGSGSGAGFDTAHEAVLPYLEAGLATPP